MIITPSGYDRGRWTMNCDHLEAVTVYEALKRMLAFYNDELRKLIEDGWNAEDAMFFAAQIRVTTSMINQFENESEVL